MRKMISRRDFLKMSAKTAVTTVAITARGELLAFDTKEPLKVTEAKQSNSNLIAQTESLKQEKALHFQYKGKRAILLYNDGEIKAFQNICTHKGGPTKLESEKLVCEWHEANFNPVTGESTKGPAPEGSRLTPIALREEDGKIFYIGS